MTILPTTERKYHYAVMALFLSAGLLLAGRLAGAEWVGFAKFLTGAFVLGNAAEWGIKRAKETK